jgi:outer membrane protein TolC
MKNRLFISAGIVVFLANLCPIAYAQNDAGGTPQPGISQVQDAGLSKDTSALVLAPGIVTPPAVSEIKAVRKKDVRAEQEPQKRKSRKFRGREPSSVQSEKVRAESIDAAMNDALKQQVRAMRDERQKQMPYLDRMYIRAAITPIKVQQKDAFLRSGPKDLSSLILRAKSVHSQARATHESINLYNRRVLYAFRKLFPEMSVSTNARVGTLSGDAFTGRDWRFSLRQPLFNGGILWNTFLQEKSSLEASQKQYDKIISDLIFDLSRAYFEYQRTLQTISEHEAAVAQMKRYADMSEEKFRENLISEIERLNVQSLYSQMQFDLETARQEFEIAKLDMQRYLDLSVEDTVQLVKTYDLSAILEKATSVEGEPGDKASDWVSVARSLGDEITPELPKVVDLSYANRPELQVEAAKLQATRLGERVRWGEFLPKAFLTWEAGALGEAWTDDIGEVYGAGYKDDPVLKREWRLMLELNWNVGGNKVSYTYDKDKKAPSITQYAAGQGTSLRKNNLTIGILDGLDAYVNVKQAEVDKLNQVVELEKAEKQVLQDVKQAFYDYQKALIQVRSNTKRAKWRERLRDLARHRLERKEVEISEYMQAESDLVRERGDLHKALKDYYSAKAALNHAVGIQEYLTLEGNHGPR